MPVGYLLTVSVWIGGMVLAVAPLGRSGRRGIVSWILSAIPNESPFIAFYVVVAATVQAILGGDLHGPLGWVPLLFVWVALGTGAVIVKRSLGAGAALDAALDSALGPGASERPRRRLPWVRIALLPLPILRWSIRRTHNVRYGEAGRYNRLDVYRHRRHPLRGPVLIHLHGFAFQSGRKSFEGRPLLHGLAGRGWLCISANYRLQPRATYEEQLVDVKKVVVWARAHASELGADPNQIFVAGSSAGAHLAVTAAVTAHDPTFQRQLEHLDTTVAGVIGLYGYYGPAGTPRDRAAFAARDYVRRDAPPMLIAHGGQDTLVPPQYAPELASRLRALSASPLVFVDWTYAQHSFDLVHSVRMETLVDGIDVFAARTVRSQPASERVGF